MLGNEGSITVIDASEITQISIFQLILLNLSSEERNKIVYENSDIEVIINQANYVSNEFRYKYRRQEGWTFENLIKIICSKYNEMYREEERVCGHSQIERDTRRRIPTSGPFGFTFNSPRNVGLDKIYITTRTGVVRFDTIP